jgi:hypothetical protein
VLDAGAILGVLCQFVRVVSGNDVCNPQLLMSHQRVCRISHQVQHDVSIQAQSALLFIAVDLMSSPPVHLRPPAAFKGLFS